MQGHPFPLDAVASSNLAAIGYEPESQTLGVQFSNGHVFHYRDVPARVWDDLQGVPSKGSFYAREVKGRFTGERVTGICRKCGDIGMLQTRCSDCGCDSYWPITTAYGKGPANANQEGAEDRAPVDLPR